MSDTCEYGRIAEVTDSQYRIVLEESSSCKTCGMHQLCARKELFIDRSAVENEFKVNQPVEMIFEKVIQTSFLLYILPLIFFFLGIILPQFLFNVNKDWLLFLIAMGSMTVAFLGIRRYYSRLDKESYSIKIKPKTKTESPSLFTGESYAN